MNNDITSTLKESDNESTESPYWLILDPKQNMSCDVFMLASQITGPFFSREDAQKHLSGRHYAFSERAKVFCMSGYWSFRYKEYYRNIEKEKTNEIFRTN